MTNNVDLKKLITNLKENISELKKSLTDEYIITFIPSIFVSFIVLKKIIDI